MIFSSVNSAGDTERRGDGRCGGGEGGCKFGCDKDINPLCLFEKCVTDELCCIRLTRVGAPDESGRRESNEAEVVALITGRFNPGEGGGGDFIFIDLLLYNCCRASVSSSNTLSRRACRAATSALNPIIAGTAVVPIIPPTTILAGPIYSRNLVSTTPVCATRIRLNIS